jgi:hypothetical protein
MAVSAQRVEEVVPPDALRLMRITNLEPRRQVPEHAIWRRCPLRHDALAVALADGARLTTRRVDLGTPAPRVHRGRSERDENGGEDYKPEWGCSRRGRFGWAHRGTTLNGRTGTPRNIAAQRIVFWAVHGARVGGAAGAVARRAKGLRRTDTLGNTVRRCPAERATWLVDVELGVITRRTERASAVTVLRDGQRSDQCEQHGRHDSDRHSPHLPSALGCLSAKSPARQAHSRDYMNGCGNRAGASGVMRGSGGTGRRLAAGRRRNQEVASCAS